MSAAALLESPETISRIHTFTIEEYERLGTAGEIAEKTELIEGVIVNKMPKSPQHRFITEYLRQRLAQIFGLDFLVSQEQPITIPAVGSQPEPDISVIRGSLRDFLARHPTTAELIVEVSVSSLAFDRIKLRSYAAAQVKECWIIDADARQAEVYSELKNDFYAVKRVVGLDGALAVQGETISLSELFPQ